MSMPAYLSDDDEEIDEGGRDVMSLYKDIHSLTAQAQAFQKKIREKDKMIVNLENEIIQTRKDNTSVTTSKSKKPCRKLSPEADKIIGFGKKYALTVSLWLHDSENAYKIVEDPKYLEHKRHTSPDNQMQGQIRDLKKLVPESFHKQFRNDDFQYWFNEGMSSQRSTSISRLRTGLDKLFKGLDVDYEDPSVLRKLNGWTLSSQNNKSDVPAGSYHFLAPIVFENFDKSNNRGIFHNEVILRAFRLIFFGPSSVFSYPSGEQPVTSIGGRPPIGKMWTLKEITPATLSATVILLRGALAHFEDRSWDSIGPNTRIKYHDYFDVYMTYCARHINSKHLKETFRWFNKQLFPTSGILINEASDSDKEEITQLFYDASSDHEDDENRKEMDNLNDQEQTDMNYYIDPEERSNVDSSLDLTNGFDNEEQLDDINAMQNITSMITYQSQSQTSADHPISTSNTPIIIPSTVVSSVLPVTTTTGGGNLATVPSNLSINVNDSLQDLPDIPNTRSSTISQTMAVITDVNTELVQDIAAQPTVSRRKHHMAEDITQECTRKLRTRPNSATVAIKNGEGGSDKSGGRGGGRGGRGDGKGGRGGGKGRRGRSGR